MAVLSNAVVTSADLFPQISCKTGVSSFGAGRWRAGNMATGTTKQREEGRVLVQM
jgi:hypothetical protein